MTEPTPTPPIGTQVSRLAAADPDAPAFTCAGRTLTRAELDLSTNRLARAFAERGVGLGDYITIALPNSIEFLQAAIAAWKLGAVPQPLPARLPDNEFDGLMALRPRALVVGRADPSGKVPSVPAGFIPDPTISDAALPEAVSPSWKAMASGGSTGRPKLIEAGGDSRVDLTPLGLALGTNEKRRPAGVGSADPQHGNDSDDNRSGDGPPRRADAAVRTGRVPAAGHRAASQLAGHGANHHAPTAARVRRRPGCLRSVLNPAVLARRLRHARPPSKRRWIELLGPDVLWELYAGTELQALAALSGGRVAGTPRIGRPSDRGRDEGARRRRQRVPARRER